MAANDRHLHFAPGVAIGMPMGLIPGGPGGMAEFAAQWQSRVLQNAPPGYLAYLNRLKSKRSGAAMKGAAMNMATGSRSRTPRRDAAQLELKIQRAEHGLR
jgi:hypothetical protein